MSGQEMQVGERLPRWKRVLFSGIGVLFIIVTLEVAARIGLRMLRGFDGEHLYQYVYDPYKNILPTPNFEDTRGIKHNSAGFRRSSEISVKKPANTYRIFLMGASTAYGLGGLWPHIQRDYRVLTNEQTIDAYLETILAEEIPGTRIEVINAAITSTWTHHHLIYLNQTILEYDPDMVLFLDGFNDFFFFNANHDQFADYSYGLPARVIMGPPTAASLAYANAWWLFRRSAAAHAAARVAQVVTQLLKGGPSQTPIVVDTALAGLKATFPRNPLKMHERSGLILAAEDIHAVFMLQPLLILERERSMVSIERELFEFDVSSNRPNYEAFMHQAVAYIRQQETEMAERVGATFIDLTQTFTDVDAQVFTDYAHLTPLGNRLVAERVSREILPLIVAEFATDGH